MPQFLHLKSPRLKLVDSKDLKSITVFFKTDNLRFYEEKNLI